METLEKVTAFVTRHRPGRVELLLFHHPFAGIQLPAGTVEEGETAADAAFREVSEETGLNTARLVRLIDVIEEEIPGDRQAIVHATPVYARPDTSSFDWAHLRRGIQVNAGRQQNGFTQVTYIEWDREPDPQYITYQITGWVPDAALTRRQRRSFFHFEFEGDTPKDWEQASDNHIFHLFWAPLNGLPRLIDPQQGYLEHAMRVYRFL